MTSVHFVLTTYRLLLELHSYSSHPFLCTLVMCMHVHLCACVYICVHVHMRHCVCICVYHVYACVNVSWDCADKFVYTVVPLSISVCVVLTPDIVVLTCLGQSSKILFLIHFYWSPRIPYNFHIAYRTRYDKLHATPVLLFTSHNWSQTNHTHIQSTYSLSF